MAEAATQHLPYAPPSNVVGVINRFRDRGLTEPVTKNTLEQVGVSPGNAPRTLATLKFLGLVDEEGHTTDTFKRVRQASTPEYPAALAEVLRNAYKPVFNIVDPAEDEVFKIEDAFRGFEPGSQRQRMVTLFLGLCAEAQLIPEDKSPKVQSPTRRQRPTSQRTPPRQKANQDSPPSEETPLRREAEDTPHNYPLVQAVVGQLPKGGTWTQKRRDLWMQAMTSAVDLAVEIEEPEEVLDGEVMPDDDQLKLGSY